MFEPGPIGEVAPFSRFSNGTTSTDLGAKLGEARGVGMGAVSLPVPPTFYRMIEAHGERALIDSFLHKRPSVSEGLAAGKALRKQVPRAAQATYETRADRPDPIEILEQQEATR